MRPRHVVCALFLILESPILAALTLGWLVTGVIYLVAELMAGSSSESVYRIALRSHRGQGRAFLPPGVALIAYVGALTAA